MAEAIDTATRRRLVRRFGPQAGAWCDELPSLLNRLERGWKLRVGQPAPPGANSSVWFCERRDGEQAVLKLSPDPSLGASEVEAFAAWRSSGRVPQVLDFDEDSGALLLEAICPGTRVSDGDPAAHLGAVGELVSDLHASAGVEVMAGFPPLIERIESMFALYERRRRDPAVASVVSANLLEDSAAAARQLATEPNQRVLLHGDLHARNLLDGGSTRGLVAIDPVACVGDPAFDLIDWVLLDSSDKHSAMPRAERLADRVGVNPEKLWRWCESTAVLVAIAQLTRGVEPSENARSLLSLALNVGVGCSSEGSPTATC